MSGNDGAKDVEGGGRDGGSARAVLLPDAALRITVLSYEYTTLRKEIVNLTQHGFVLLAIGAPLIAGFCLQANFSQVATWLAAPASARGGDQSPRRRKAAGLRDGLGKDHRYSKPAK